MGKDRENEYDGKTDVRTIDNPEDRNDIIVHDVPFIMDEGDKLVDLDDVIDQIEKGNYDFVDDIIEKALED